MVIFIVRRTIAVRWTFFLFEPKGGLAFDPKYISRHAAEG